MLNWHQSTLTDTHTHTHTHTHTVFRDLLADWAMNWSPESTQTLLNAAGSATHTLLNAPDQLSQLARREKTGGLDKTSPITRRHSTHTLIYKTLPMTTYSMLT